MTVQTAHPSVAELLDLFRDAAPDRVEEQFSRLAAAVWGPEGATAAALPSVPAVVALLATVDEDRRGHLAVLLGLLVETEYPGEPGPLTAAVREGLDTYLELLGATTAEQPLRPALIYLVSHFGADRERILAVAAGLSLDEHDSSRLERALRELDLTSPDVGRVWPSPAVWKLDEEEKEFDKEAINSLTPEQAQSNWENDTRTIWAYSGMRAYWSVRHGVPAEVSYPMPADAGDLTDPPHLAPEAFSRHGDALRCPSCRGGLDYREDSARCASCGTNFPLRGGLLNLTAGQSDEAWRESAAEKADDTTNNLLSKLAAMKTMGLYYEAVLRPAYLRIAGSNWGLDVTPSDEDEYLLEHTAPVDGPFLDLCAGAGRWTAVLAEAIGSDRLIALDMGLPMLNALRNLLPKTPAVVASALELPFDDSSLGGVNMWNALQAFPEQADTAISEVGRVLKPGGTFTMMAFRWSDNPVDRYFQASHYFPSRPAGQLLFDLSDVRQWLADAGLEVRHEGGTGTFFFFTCVRAA